MKDKKQSTMNRVLEYMFKNKLNSAITFIIYLLICKIIDMNTIQWFGDDIFIREGNILEFIVCYVLHVHVNIYIYIYIYIYYIYTNVYIYITYLHTYVYAYT